jgi:hypothetical protein
MDLNVTSNVDDVDQELCVTLMLDIVHMDARRTGEALNVTVHVMIELLDSQNTKRDGRKNSDRIYNSY